jgi:hypothetical protein
MENGILVEKKYNDEDPVELCNKKWVPQNVAEYFFFDEFGFLSINDRKILECYSEFTETMRIIFENLKFYYSKLSKKVISEDDLDDISFPRVPGDLEFKGLEHYMEQALKSVAKQVEAQTEKKNIMMVSESIA